MKARLGRAMALLAFYAATGILAAKLMQHSDHAARERQIRDEVIANWGQAIAACANGRHIQVGDVMVRCVVVNNGRGK